MRKKYKWLELMALVIAIFGSVFFSGKETYAVLSSQAENSLKKNYANSLKICYDNGTMKNEVIIESSGAGQIMGIDPIGNNKFFLNDGGAGQIYEYTSVGNGERVNCLTFLSFDSDKSIFKKFGKTGLNESMSKAAAGTFLENMGYDKINYLNGGPGKTYNNFCLNIKGIGDLCWDNEDAVFPAAGPTSNTIEKNGYRYIIEDDDGSAGIRISKGDFTCKIEMPKGPLKNFQNTRCGNVTGPSVQKMIQEGTTNVGGNYELVNRNAYSKARSWLAGSGEQEPFSDQEIHDLYMAYLNDAGVSVNIENCADEKPSSGNVIYQLMDDKKTFKWCAVDTGNVSSGWRFPGFVIDGKAGSSQRYVFDRLMNIQQLLSAISQWNQLHPEAAIAATKDVNKNNTDDTKDDLCYSSAGAMGWILCPAIVATSGVGNFMWDQMKGFLQFDVSILDQGQSVEQGWNTMRDIANVIFIILFLFVIFSQLTGVGIDNYGIKKILPKLVVIAILINLSFVLCRIFVDLSNILGVGLQKMFEGLAENIQTIDTNPDATAGMFVGGATGLVVAGVGIAFLFNFLKGQNWGQFFASAAIAIGGALIVVLVGIFVGFLILSIRQAGVVIAIVLSPIAVVLYALPNTEKLSKKWWEIFKALLIVYPICGAMMGAGVFAKKLFVDKAPLIAMIISVVPFFFVPILLKNSLSAMGNLGGKISALGRGLGRKGSSAATGAVKNFDRYKDWSQAQNRMASMRREKRRIANYKNRGNLTDAQKAALGRAQARLAAVESQQEKDFSSVFDRQDRGEVVNEVNRALSGDNIPLAGASIDAALAKGAEDNVMEALYNRDFNGLSNDMQHRILQSLNSSNSEVLKAYAKYRQTGGRGNLKDWMNGTNTDQNAEGIKSGSLANHLKERGIGAMNDLSRDALKFMNDKGVGVKLSNSLGSDYSKMLGNASINARDPRAKAEIERMIGKALANGGSIKDFGFTASSLGSMRTDTLKAIRNGYMEGGMSQTDAENKIRSELANEIAAAKNDNFIRNKMDSTVRDFLLDGGQLPPPSTQPQSQNPPDIQGPQ